MPPSTQQVNKSNKKMQQTQLMLTLLLSWTALCFGQNDTTLEGLKVGRWEVIDELDNVRFIKKGNYKIIPIGTYDKIRQHGVSFQEVQFVGSTSVVFFAGQSGNNLSVKDSIWQTADSNGKLFETHFWQNGILLSTKSYDPYGNLIAHDSSDIEHNRSFYLTYIDNQLFKKAFYTPESQNQQIEIFYPDNNLAISNAEPSCYSLLDDTAAKTFPIRLSCKKDLALLSINSSSNNVKIDFPNLALPYRLTPKDTATIYVIFTPTSASDNAMDTITISTSEENVLPYKIYCRTKAAHIDGTNIENKKHIALSKSIDKYLLIAPMGSVTDVSITNSAGQKKNYEIRGITKISLDAFEVGDFELSIVGCYTGGDMILTISK